MPLSVRPVTYPLVQWWYSYTTRILSLTDVAPKEVFHMDSQAQDAVLSVIMEHKKTTSVRLTLFHGWIKGST